MKKIKKLNNLLIIGLIFLYLPILLFIILDIFHIKINSYYIKDSYILFLLASGIYFLPEGFEKGEFTKKDIKSFFIKVFLPLFVMIILIATSISIYK